VCPIEALEFGIYSGIALAFGVYSEMALEFGVYVYGLCSTVQGLGRFVPQPTVYA